MFKGLQKSIFLFHIKFWFKSVNRKILFYSHEVKFPEIHTGIIGLIDEITNNHWRYPSLEQNDFVINKSFSLGPC